MSGLSIVAQHIDDYEDGPCQCCVPQKGDSIYVRRGGPEGDDYHGTVTGNTERCRLEGCGGYRIRVKWPDGQVTKPCSDGLRKEGPNAWRIG